MTASRGVLATVMAGLVLLTGFGTVTGPAWAGGTLLGTWENWEARRYDGPDGELRCIARAFHPAILKGEVLWVINSDLPVGNIGYLAIDPRLVGGAESVRIEIDTGETFDLVEGRDAWFYSPISVSEPLRQALRIGLEATLILEAAERGDARATVPLTGFTSATEAATRACSADGARS